MYRSPELLMWHTCTCTWYVPAPRYPKCTSFFLFFFFFYPNHEITTGHQSSRNMKFCTVFWIFAECMRPVFRAHETLCELSFGNNYLAIKTYQYTPLGRSKMLTLKKNLKIQFVQNERSRWFQYIVKIVYWIKYQLRFYRNAYRFRLTL